ncbi:TfpX/TfpZ family type IV pilin accessory protein [Acinetobacter johnsonii]|uniref:TfpX/TfpZ family type IV pilin accessory protein n=1 Tax=Acinetobacter johnsonii TaxID=40214 RepID=UPI002FD91B93|nr:TfpX/TfpZ family type IV pilin accessory protein [Acinetobacter johnsonii]
MSTRIKAFLIHGLISISVAVLVVGLVFFIWYPAPLAKAVGVTHIFFMMLAIDVILGPLLTLLVYKKGKKTLFFDLTVIVLLQISALGYGLWTISQGRPAWLVFSVDRFDIVRVNEIDNRNIKKAQQAYQNPSWFYPQWVAATSPKNVEENNTVTFEAVFSGIDIAQRPNLYSSLLNQKKQIQSKAKNIEDLHHYNNNLLVQKILLKYPQANAFVPLKANAVDMTVLINKEKGEVVKIVDLRPWK